jgi:cytochrome c-type biogenesis protein CcsB
MEIVILISIVFYMIGSACYVAYLFLQKDQLHRWGFAMTVAAFLLHTVSIGAEWVLSRHFPVGNLFQVLNLSAWTIAAVFLAVQHRFKLRILGVYAAPLIALVMLAVSQLPREPTQINPIFKSFWLVSHILAIFAGDACLALACGIGILYLIQENAIKSKRPGFFFRRLPSLDLLDATGYACIIAGFTLLTLGLIAGFIYAKTVWGRFWSWDPKEVWSGISWLFYAALLHERLTVGWRGRRSAVMAIIGFCVLLFTFFGVNFLMQGHHGEFTRW